LARSCRCPRSMCFAGRRDADGGPKYGKRPWRQRRPIEVLPKPAAVLLRQGRSAHLGQPSDLSRRATAYYLVSTARPAASRRVAADPRTDGIGIRMHACRALIGFRPCISVISGMSCAMACRIRYLYQFRERSRARRSHGAWVAKFPRISPRAATAAVTSRRLNDIACT